MLTTDCVCRILRGTTKSASPISFTRSSTATQSFWKRNRTRSSWAFASSSSLSPFATALRATSTRSWPHSPHHLLQFNFRVSSHDYFWSPNVRTLHMNEREVLPHCTVCTEQRFLRIRLSCRCQAYPSIFAHLFIVVKSGAALTPVLMSHVSHPAERLTSPIHTLFYPMSVY